MGVSKAPISVSICYLTGREEPRLDWALEALIEQTVPRDRIDLVVIDALAERPEPRPPVVDANVFALVYSMPSDRELTIRVMPPKPNVWQGKHRITNRDWWGAANGRNTGIVLAQHDYLCFLDDRCRPGPKWFDTVRQGYAERVSVIAGSYEKLEGPEGARRVSNDHRRGLYPHGLVDCGGGWLYGCTFAMPLAWALEVNGFEEGTDSLTGEDYIFGLMLGNAGHRIDFEPDLFVLQDRAPGNESTKGTYACTDKGTSPNDKSHAALERFGKARRTEFTPDLAELRAQLAAGGTFPVPDPNGDHRDWYDRQLIRDM